MARVTPKEVQDLLGDECSTSISMRPFIAPASAMVDWLVGLDSLSQLTSDLLKEIECFLAAHFYTFQDQQYQSKNTGKASGTFQGKTNMVLSSTYYGQTAMLMDVTGRLAQRSKDAETGLRRVAGGQWLGSCYNQGNPPSTGPITSTDLP